MNFFNSSQSLDRTTRTSCNVFIPAILMLTVSSSSLLADANYYSNPKQKSSSNGITASINDFHNELYTTLHSGMTYSVPTRHVSTYDTLELYRIKVPEETVRAVVASDDEYVIDFSPLLSDLED